MYTNEQSFYWQFIWDHCDLISSDLNMFVNIPDPFLRSHTSRKLLEVSPFDPVAVADLIDSDWNFSMTRLKEWKDRLDGNPVFVTALAKHYQQLGEPEAEPWLKKAIQLSPTLGNYLALAKFYQQQEKMDLWLATLESYLETPVQGLDHAIVREKIAWHYMRKNEPEKALPFAEAAAETWRSASMTCAAACHEKLGNWEEAERWVRRDAERYDSARHLWYHFCLRTGHGDQQAAQQFWNEHLESVQDAMTLYEYQSNGLLLLLEGNLAEAAQSFEKASALTKSPFYPAHLALIYAELGDQEKRDASFAASLARHQTSLDETTDPAVQQDQSAQVSVLHWIRDLVTNDQDAPPDLDAVKKSLAGIQDAEAIAYCRYLVGKALLMQGQQEAGRAMLTEFLNLGYQPNAILGLAEVDLKPKADSK